MNQEPIFIRSKARLYTGWFFLLSVFLVWLPSADIVDLIIRNKEIIFGRYSRGQFGSLFILSLLLMAGAALCFSQIKTIGEMILVSVMVSFSVAVSAFVLIVASGFVVSISGKARYVEAELETHQDGVNIKGLVRHRPPNELFKIPQIDRPEQQRSYPNAPAGYPAFDVTLTSDNYGFRNPTKDGKLLAHYPIVAVGDSFVASSHVSDDQAWVSLLSKKINTPIYNLGVSGSDPGNYLNNFVLLGRQFKPKLVLFMLYEGNDFKGITPANFTLAQDDKNIVLKEKSISDKKVRDSKAGHGSRKSLSQQIAYWVSASPVIKGLKRFSSEDLEAIGKNNAVPNYAEKVGFMPIKLSLNGSDKFYSFEPKRLIYLYEEKDNFKKSENWRHVESIMQNMVDLGKKDGFSVVFLYAPSTPHVVMPLVKDKIPADQLRNFSAYQMDNLPEAEQFKNNVFEWMGNEEQVFTDYCSEQHFQCLGLTTYLQEATAQGQQLYYTYDQHWTPEGNKVVADVLSMTLKQNGMP